jgi:hypothetical protein
VRRSSGECYSAEESVIMPDFEIQIFNREPITSLFGAMHFPNDFEKAGILAAWKFAGILRSATNEQVAAIGSDRIWAVQDMARGYPEIAREAKKAAYRGTQVGNLGSFLWHAWKTGIPATVDDAIRAAEKTGGTKYPGVRSTFMAAKTGFSRVSHFWAVLSMEYENRTPRDWRLFISQSEAFLTEMRRLETTGATFRSPKFHVSRSDFDWQVFGKLRFGTLPKFLQEGCRKAAENTSPEIIGLLLRGSKARHVLPVFNLDMGRKCTMSLFPAPGLRRKWGFRTERFAVGKSRNDLGLIMP